MRRRVLVWTLVGCVMGLTLVACVPQGETQEQDPVLPVRLSTESMTYEEQLKLLDERAEEYVPKVVTLEDGTQVQSVPFSGPNMHLAGLSTFDHNVYYLDGNNRGCRSCHETGLLDLVNNQILGHMELSTNLGVDLTVTQCVYCHDTVSLNTADILHSVHSGESFQGDCKSCHVAVDGEYALWDEAKHKTLNGLTPIAADNLDGTFTFEQTTMADPFQVAWLYDEFEVQMYDKQKKGEANTDEEFNNWELNFTGAVETPQAIKLPDLIAEAEKAGAVEEFMSSYQCVDDAPSGGGALACNVMMKGIKFDWLMNRVGVTDDAVAVTPITPIGNDWSTTVDLELIDDVNGSYMIYEMNGERLPWDEGFPIRFWCTGVGAGGSMKWISELRFERLEDLNSGLYLQSNTLEGGTSVDFVPHVGFTHINDGQIIPANEPFELTGYAFGVNKRIDTVEISFDQGATWKTLDTSNSDAGVWVYWHFTQAFEPGAYTVTVRATNEAGVSTGELGTMILNVQ